MRKSILFLVILLFLCASSAFGQIAVGYATDGNTLSLSTNPAMKIRGELRVNTKSYNQANWSYSDKGIAQAYMLFNIFGSGKVTLYGGFGAGVNLLTSNDKWLSVNIPVGLQMNPVNSLPELYLFGEYTPMIIPDDEISAIHCMSVGFRMVLTKKQ